MTTITASLERSLQNCSLNQTTTTRNRRRVVGDGGGGRPSSSNSSDRQTRNRSHSYGYNSNNNNQDYIMNNSQHDPHTQSNASSSDDNSTFVELNSQVSLPYHWEQCLDLKTGELYYMNWSNGMKAKEDPRTVATGYNGDYYSEEGEEEDEEENDDGNGDDEDESNGYDSEGSSTESYSSPSCKNLRSAKKLVGANGNRQHQQQQEQQQQQQLNQESVLVVAGCKSCLMYYMVPRHVVDCPKCSGQLLHFPANHPPISTSSP